MPAVMQNRFVSVRVDNRGRIISFGNKATGTELIRHPSAAEAWRLVFQTGRYTLDFVYGSQQKPQKIETLRQTGRQSITFHYANVKGDASYRIRASFTLSLDDDSPQLQASAQIENLARHELQEVEFPLLNGIGDFSEGKKEKTGLIAASDRGLFYPNIFHEGFPELSLESDHFSRLDDTAMFMHDNLNGVWCDIYNSRQGLYSGYHSKREDIFSLKLIRSPKEFPKFAVHHYPKNTPRWLGINAVHVPRIAPGKRWQSDIVRLAPHRGDWHSGADIYAAYRNQTVHVGPSPDWFKNDFYGWSAILGKIYIGEKAFDFRQCAREMIKEQDATGIKMVFYYGHTPLGAEGADFDNSPAPDLGGPKEFRKMVDTLHQHDCRIILLDHFHRWVNKEVPQYRDHDLGRYEVWNEKGQPSEDAWGKETVLSLKYFKGPTSIWREMCPAEESWRQHYYRNVEMMARLGVDGLEPDLFVPSLRCFNPNHSHPVGARLMPYKLDFIHQAREIARKINPDFIFIGESLYPESISCLDSFFSRYAEERENIFRYMFPQIPGQQARVENYSYDNVNKSLMLGLAVDAEIWGIREFTHKACPELARYIKETNQFKKKYYSIMLKGMYRDTVGAKVSGNLLYSILDAGATGKALILRNPSKAPVPCKAAFAGRICGNLILWQPFKGEKRVAKLPLNLTIPPCGVAVFLAESQGSLA